MDNTGKNIWKIAHINNDGWETRADCEYYEGNYQDAVLKYNPTHLDNITIKPTDFHDSTMIRTSDKQVLNIRYNAATACQKTGDYIYKEYKQTIDIIHMKIDESVKNGYNSVYFENFKYIDSNDDYKKFKYYFTCLGFLFEFFERQNNLKISW
jgi:hypothetical protein